MSRNSVLHDLAEQAATRHNVPLRVVAAVVEVESAWNPWAWNPEPHYRYLVDARTGRPFRTLTAEERKTQIPPEDFPSCPGLPDDRDAEWWGQQASWGLMQVMGAVAREHGFRDWHPRLCDPYWGLEVGCKFLRHLADRHIDQHGWPGVVRAYNTGSPRPSDMGVIYASKIQSHGGFA